MANTGAEYETLWGIDDLIPVDVNAVRADDHAEIVVLTPDNALVVAIIVHTEDAPTEYRFHDAIPAGHDAVVHTDGSVRFYDSDGNETSGILPPWAVDADGEPIATSYRLEGSTLVQTVDHHGAAYPVVADPAWIPVAVGACTVSPTCAYVATYVITTGPAIAGFAWRNRGSVLSGDSDAPGRRPTNTCNNRNRSGC